MREISYAEAKVEALTEVMEADPSICLIGSYFLGLSPRRTLLDRLRERFPSRVFDPPISEAGVCGIGVGAAMAGLRPIVDVATASFLFNAFAQVVNEAANIHYMTGGQVSVPLIIHILHGLRGGGGAQHSHSPQAMLWNTPGLQIMLPSTPADVKGLLKTAARSANPTIFVDHARLFETRGPVPDALGEIEFGRAEVRREGRDVTLVATSLMVQVALRAASELAGRGVDAEVLDLRTLVPLDRAALLGSVRRTGRLVVVDECHTSCGVGAEISAIVAEDAFHALKAPIRRVATPDVPIPASPLLEKQIEPTPEKVVAAALEVMK